MVGGWGGEEAGGRICKLFNGERIFEIIVNNWRYIESPSAYIASGCIKSRNAMEQVEKGKGKFK